MKRNKIDYDKINNNLEISPRKVVKKLKEKSWILDMYADLVQNFKWTKIVELNLHYKLVISDLAWNDYYLGGEVAVGLSEIVDEVSNR